MKSLRHPYVLALSACMLTLVGAPAWGSPVMGFGSPMPIIQAPQSQSPDQAQPADKAQTFTGTVVQQGDSFALEASSGATYKLSGASDAKSFVGKSVTVIGTLDASSNTIAVQSIHGSSN
jgi:Protein of unknown function (DUF5818)